jgi:hypothetical protein
VKTSCACDGMTSSDDEAALLRAAQTGFVTGALSKKGSMFSVPDAPGAKVGVIGSGQGMTEVRGRCRLSLSVVALSLSLSV